MKTNKTKQLEAIILERFGTPIGERPTYYGVPDEREDSPEDTTSKKSKRVHASLLK
jgi:hypothetical protein